MRYIMKGRFKLNETKRNETKRRRSFFLQLYYNHINILNRRLDRRTRKIATTITTISSVIITTTTTKTTTTTTTKMQLNTL